jgi:hypothetical protein
MSNKQHALKYLDKDFQSYLFGVLHKLKESRQSILSMN